MLQNLFYIVVALLLVLLNGFFVAAEFGLVKLRQTQARALADARGWRGRVLVGVHAHLDAYLSACQLGITLASLGLGWVGEPAFARLLEPLFAHFGGVSPDTLHIVSFVFAFTVISFLHIVLGELAPKSLAIRRTEPVALWTAAPLYAFYWVMYPAIRLLNASANAILRMVGLDIDRHHDAHYSREELKLILHAKRAHGDDADGGEEFTMMSRALDLPELVAGDLLRTRDQLASLRDGATLDDVLAEFRRTRYSRYPWFDADGEQVRGVLHIKDLLGTLARHADIGDIREVRRPAVVVPIDSPVLDVLPRFRSGDTHIALCAEEHGRIVGFFTLEDIMEVIVGDIEDEHHPRTAARSARAADGSFSIAGTVPIYRLERLLDRDIEAPTDVNSVGGLIIHRLERLPLEGETLAFDGFDLTVRKLRGARIQAIDVHPAQIAQPDGKRP
jgi:CBS domain containing-hemolysin-like protein